MQGVLAFRVVLLNTADVKLRVAVNRSSRHFSLAYLSLLSFEITRILRLFFFLFLF